jgi:hypothetical protein
MESSSKQEKSRAAQVVDILTSAILRIQAKQSVDELLHQGGSQQASNRDTVIDTHVGQRNH